LTGEITLRGRILPVGGLKEKLLTAHRADVQKVILPARNAKDLTEIPRNILKKLNLVMVESIETTLEETLLPPLEDAPLATPEA
jgi:ATP-dependent Lon protease